MGVDIDLGRIGRGRCGRGRGRFRRPRRVLAATDAERGLGFAAGAKSNHEVNGTGGHQQYAWGATPPTVAGAHFALGCDFDPPPPFARLVEIGTRVGGLVRGQYAAREGALERIGHKKLMEANQEATELLHRFQANRELPLFTSCCPGWIHWVELHRPDLLAHLSTTKSPQQMHGALAKRGSFARSLGAEYADGRREPYVVSVMPCTAKKDEAERPGNAGDIDRVITTRELARMIRSRGIAFNALSEDGAFDNPLGASSGAAQIFGASGGVMEAIARAAAHLLGVEDAQPLDWQAFRGVNEAVKSAEIPGLGRVAVCNGIAAAQQLLKSDHWRDEFVAIEVMACVGGCLGGGGEPKSTDPQVLQKRMRAVYDIDRNNPRRRSFENPEVQALYEQELDRPNSPKAHALLHTSYAMRRSKRLMLMRFLDCVDRRDGAGAAALMDPQAIWATASPFGEVHGAAAIAELINQRLPPRGFGPAYVRHRMRCASDPDDLGVISVNGEHCHFDVDLGTLQESDGSRTVIRRLERHVEQPA